MKAKKGDTPRRSAPAAEGTLKGSRLEPITPLPSFWFSWAQFFPDTEAYK